MAEILIVEDERTLFLSLRICLVDEGHEIRGAHNLAAARAATRRGTSTATFLSG